MKSTAANILSWFFLCLFLAVNSLSLHIYVHSVEEHLCSAQIENQHSDDDTEDTCELCRIAFIVQDFSYDQPFEIILNSESQIIGFDNENLFLYRNRLYITEALNKHRNKAPPHLI